MAINDLSPGFVKINYHNGTHLHTMTLPTKFSGTPVPGTAPSLLTHNGGASAFSTAIGDFSTVLLPLFGTTVTIDTADVWYKPLPSDDPVWIYTFGADDDGTSAGASIAAQQQVFTFRTDLGGLFRLYLMESAVTVNLSVSYATMAADSKAVADYVMGNGSWIYGRDNGEPIVSLGYKTKINDVLRRRYLTG